LQNKKEIAVRKYVYPFLKKVRKIGYQLKVSILRPQGYEPCALPLRQTDLVGCYFLGFF
jgi:hypothetical protein